MKSWVGGLDPRAILVTRLRFLGDVILTTPTLAALARAYPGAAIDYLCQSPFDQVLKGNPHLRDLYVLPQQDRRDFWRLMRHLRGRYDVVIDLFCNPRSAWLSWMTGARLRVGRARFPRSLLYNKVPPEGPRVEPATRFHLRFAEVLCGPCALEDPSVWLQDRESAEGRRILEDRGLGGQSIAFLIGASQAAKEWPTAYFVRLAALMRMEQRYTPLFLGQPDKRRLLDEIRELSHSQVVILPELDLRTLAGLLKNCRALVTGDGGIMHLAIALGVPTLALFGPSIPEIWFPYTHLNHAAVLTPEMAGAEDAEDEQGLAALSPELVWRALQSLLERT